MSRGDDDAWTHAQRREFDHPGVRAVLDPMPMDRIEEWFQRPIHSVTYAKPLGHWLPGDGAPALADDDPAVMQAVGRCAAQRVRLTLPGPMALGVGAVHPAPCGWCQYPLAALLAACDHAVWRSRLVLAEVWTWYQDPAKRSGAEYHRAGRSDAYENPAWADFWAIPTDRRSALVRAAQYPDGVPT